MRVLNSYPPHHRMAFASSSIPYPHPYGSPHGLLSQRERYGLTTFRTSNLDDLGSAYPPVARHLRKMMGEHLLLATYLLVQACQPLWLVGSHDVYQRFTWVSHVIPP